MDITKKLFTCATVEEIVSENCGATALSVGRDVIADSVYVNQTINNVPPEKPLKSIIFNVQEPITTFSGRVDFLESLHKTLKENSMAVLTQQAALPVIAATGGVGKTETVRMYIEQAKKAGIYKHIIWIDADPHSTAQNQFRRLATQLKISVFDCDDRTQPIPLEEIAPQVYELLCKNSTVLVVFDNAEALQDDEEMGIQGIEELLPPSLSSHCINPVILVTSRNQNWELQKVIELDLWTFEECITFLLTILNLPRTPETAETARKLSDLFGRLPIALQAAVAVITQQKRRRRTIAVGGNYTMEDLIEDYTVGTGKRTVLDSKPLNQKKQTPMMTLWTVTKEKIREMDHGPLAIKILNRMSFMSPTKIPKAFLATVLQGPQEASTDDESLSVALTHLIDYSLITELEDSYTMHRMIQDVTIEHLKSKSEGDFDTILLELSQEMAKVVSCLQHRDQNEDIVANAVLLAKHMFPYLAKDEFREYTLLVGNFLHQSFQYKSALDLYEKALKASEQSLGSNHEKTLEIKSKMAAALTDSGNFQGGKKVYLEVLGVQMEVVGPDHPFTLRTENKIGEILEKEGKSEEALVIFSSILERWEKLKDAGIADAIYTKTCILRLFTTRGEFEKAIALAEDLIKKNLNLTDEVVVAAVNLLNTGFTTPIPLLSRAEAEKQLKSTLEMLAVGERQDNIDVVSSCSRYVAKYLQDRGEVQMTKGIYEKLLEKQERVLGSHHPSSLATKCDLGSALNRTGDWERALEVLWDVAEARENIFGPHHPESLEAKSAIASAMQEQSKLQEAFEMLQEVLTVREETQGPKHPDTLRTKRQMATVLQSQQKFDGALTMFLEVLRGQEDLWGATHQEVLATQFSIGGLYFEEGKYSRATRLAHDVLSKTALTMNYFVQYFTFRKLLLTSWSFQITASIPDPPDHHELVTQIFEATHLHPESARLLLQASDWNIQLALNQLQDVNDSNTLKLGDYIFLCVPLFNSNRDKILEFAWQQFPKIEASDPTLRATTSNTTLNLESRHKESRVAIKDTIQLLSVLEPTDPSEADSVSENSSINQEVGDTLVSEFEANFGAFMEDVDDTMGRIGEYIKEIKTMQTNNAVHGERSNMVMVPFLLRQFQDQQNLPLSDTFKDEISKYVTYLENLDLSLGEDEEDSPVSFPLDKNHLAPYFVKLTGIKVKDGHLLGDTHGDRKADLFVWLRYLPVEGSAVTDEGGGAREGQTSSSASLPLNPLEAAQPATGSETETESKIEIDDESEDAVKMVVFCLPDRTALARQFKSSATGEDLRTFLHNLRPDFAIANYALTFHPTTNQLPNNDLLIVTLSLLPTIS